MFTREAAMKKRNAVIIFALFVFAATLAFKEAATSNVALFWIIKNKVEKSPTSKVWKNAKKGELIYGGDYVRTLPKSFALIKFNDSSTLRLGPESEVQVNGLDNPSNMYVNNGDVGFSMAKRKDKPFEFTTPTSVASIRGTQGILVVGLNNSDFLTIVEGLVRFVNNFSHDSVNVGAGETGVSSSNGSISIHKSTQADLERLAQLNDQFGRKHELKIQYRDSNGQMREIIINTQQ